MKLERRYVEKPWGRMRLPAMFESLAGKRIGEMWFTGASDDPLLVKYLFTSERLSIQVHPDDAPARRRGLPSGKTECWTIIEAEPDATLGLGPTRTVSKDELRAAALDGSIEQLIDWRPVRRGDFFMVPAGTIHAIGGGVSLIEFQQNADVTYRLYDYGRPRELHLDDAVDVATLEPYPAALAGRLTDGAPQVLVDGPNFILVHTSSDVLQESRRWIIPLEGEVRAGRESGGPGDCLLVGSGMRVEADGRMLVGATA